MTAKFEVESGIPVPAIKYPNRKPRAPRTFSKHGFPFPTMEVGDSFFTDMPQGTVTSNAAAYTRKTGKRFVTRSVDGGVRVWRQQ